MDSRPAEANDHQECKMKLRHLSGIVVVCLATASLFAQTDAAATREDVLKLFDVMKIHQQMTSVMTTIATQQRAMMHEGMRKHFPQISDKELARLDKFTTDTMKDMPIDGMLDDMIPVYQKHLTKGDVDAMSAFYASPTGQKLLHEMPAMTAESMQAAGPHIQAMMEKVMDRAEKMAEEDRKKQSASPQPATDKN
jgi:hypothetical protein